SSGRGGMATATVLRSSSPSRFMPEITATNRPSSGKVAATANASEPGRTSYLGAMWFMNQSGRNRAKVTTNSRMTSNQLHLLRNHAMVAAANVMEAAVAPSTTISNSHQPETSISSSIGLKMNMKGSTAVRMA